MMYRNVMKGLPFFEERRYHIIELLKFRFRKGKPRTGFTSDLFIFLLSIRCLVKTFFERTPSTLLTAITDIGRFGEGKYIFRKRCRRKYTCRKSSTVCYSSRRSAGKTSAGNTDAGKQHGSR